MSIPSKGSRKITVGTQQYRWYIRRGPTHFQGDLAAPVTCAVESADGGSVLQITFAWNRYKHYEGAEYPVTPKDIEQCIREAIVQGWKPRESGPLFPFTSKRRAAQ